MAKEPRSGKTETLTIRLDPKSRFVLDFVARLKGQTITTVVERALIESANQQTLFRDDEVWRWDDFWSVHEGARALAMAAVPELFPTFEEERRLDFARAHAPFFFSSFEQMTQNSVPKISQCHLAFLEILWPRIDEFMRLHDESKSSDFFAAGRAMQNALIEAGFTPPGWPPKKKSKVESS
jgi:hypothetical protein